MNQYELNIAIEKLIAEKDSRNESYSKKDIEFIQQHEGAGGLAKKGAKGKGLLHEFYTPDYICELMYKLAVHHGYDGGAVLEPSIATGRIIAPFPNKKNITGFEINPISKRICEITYPEITLYNQYFETAFLKEPLYRSKRTKSEGITWLKDYPFSLVIGNPPYGKYANKYSSFFKMPKMAQIELFFIYKGIELLKKGGLLVFITSSNFLRNGKSYNSEKMTISHYADLIDAYRLPPVFKSTQVPTDILIFKKK